MENGVLMKCSIVILLVATAALAGAQSDTVRVNPDSGALSVNDTVRVWSQKLKVKAKRGVISRIPQDSVAFTAPSGFRKLPREFVGDIASIDRIDVLEGRRRSLPRAGGKMLLGGLVGAAGGVLIGRGVGFVAARTVFRGYQDSDGESWDLQGALQWYGSAIFGLAGAATGAFGGLIDGARSYESWRRVR